MSTHRAWRPRMDRDPLLNPFAPVTQQHSPTFDRVELAETEEEEGKGSLSPAEQQTDESSPAKTSGPP